jgi:alpha-D-ribose 1-methylphosphonate 5-triphosphate synthase subunit PhnG
MQWLRFFPGVASNYRFHFVGQCCVEYVSGKDTGKRRFKRLPDILDALLQKSDEYRDFEMHLEKSAKAKGVDPQDFRDVDPWPEFRW